MMHYVLLVNKLDPSWKDETSLQSTIESDEDAAVRRSCDPVVIVIIYYSHQMVGVY